MERSAARHAFYAVALLLGFYAVALGTIAALAALDVSVLLHSRFSLRLYAEAKLIGLTAVIAAPLIRGLTVSRVRRGRSPAGIAVTPEEQPELWARVRRIAELVGTRPPTELRLIPEVNAAVSESTRLLGLLPGRRRLYLGIPLQLGLTTRQLDAVLAHELGHCANHDVRFGAATVRGRTGLLALTRAYQGDRSVVHWPLRSFFLWYARLYLRLTQSVSRGQELAADRTAARIAGSEATAAALRRVPELNAAFDYYLDRYATVGWRADVLPRSEDLYAGFQALLAEPSRRTEMAAVGERAVAEAQPADPYDSHPPVRERIAALTRIPPEHRPPAARDLAAADLAAADAPASALLRDADRVCAAVAECALPPEAAEQRRVGWAELAREAGRERLARESRPLLEAAAAIAGRPVTGLAGLLDTIDSAGLDAVAEAVADGLAGSEESGPASGPAGRPAARNAFRQALVPVVCTALVETGGARWTHDWAHALHLQYAPGIEEPTEAAMAALTGEAAPSTAALRTLFALAAAPALTPPATPAPISSPSATAAPATPAPGHPRGHAGPAAQGRA